MHCWSVVTVVFVWHRSLIIFQLLSMVWNGESARRSKEGCQIWRVVGGPFVWDYEISKGHYFNPIDERIFENILDQGKLNQLNIKLNKFNRISDLIERILAKYRIYGLWVSNVVHQLFRRLGIKAGSYVTHLGNYYIIKAVEKSCLRR